MLDICIFAIASAKILNRQCKIEYKRLINQHRANDLSKQNVFLEKPSKKTVCLIGLKKRFER